MGVSRSSFFATPTTSRRSSLAIKQRVEPALVVEDEDGGTMRPQVLLANYVHFDARERVHQVRIRREHQVRAAPQIAAGECRGDSDHRRRRQRRERPDEPTDFPECRRTSTLEVVDGPAPSTADLRELSIRVDEMRDEPTMSSNGRSSWLSV